MPHALIVDDEPNTLSAMADLVQHEGFSTAAAGTLAGARKRLAEQPPDLVIVDLLLPDGKGPDIIKEIDPTHRAEVILITGHATVDSAVDALRNGVLDYLTKPVDTRRLRTILANVSRTLALKEEIGSLRDELRRLGRFGNMVGSSAKMQSVYDLMTKVAPTEATVLLVGESGTGKEVVASDIHAMSARRKQPFLPLNCGAVPANLIESELFGHERGSFTGAVQLHRGYFERASQGTLFLDEITEMPAELQVKLLRVLETGMAFRVGGDQPIPMDVRVVAATNRSPDAAVKEGKLREDLLYRLNVFPIAIPPLRDREGDIERLAEYFLEHHNRAEGTSKKFSAAARRRMTTYQWPGNVRELKNVIQREFILASDLVEMSSLPVTAGGVGADAASGSLDGIKIGSSLAEVERCLILGTLEQCGGDKRKAAEILGISLKTLYNRLNLYAART